MKLYRLIFLILPVTFACESENSYDEDVMMDLKMMEVAESETPSPPPADDQSFEKADRKLIKTTNLSIQVENIDVTSRAIEKLLKTYEAYVDSDNFLNDSYRKERSMTIRVPSDRIDPLMQKLEETGIYLASRNMAVRDVSREYVDTELRLRSKRVVLEQYIKLLDRATKIEDILKIEDKIRVIREEIEAKEGQLRFMTDQVAMSTIHLEMYQEILHADAPPTKGFWLKAGERMVLGWDLVKGFMLGIITLWPLFALAFVSWTGVMVFKRRKSRSI